jgi:UDP-N-acetylglucosamine 2-epimerase (non-hydrolysing)
MLVTIVAGARPNFVKIAPIIEAIREAVNSGAEIEYRLVHTGQHYDRNMSGSFFEQLGIPEPHVNLECGGGSQAVQTASIMVNFEKELMQIRPDLVLVVGDVTSTMACTITAKKLNVDVVHVEAGIRSGDMTMPEEINRIVTDSLCDHFFTTSEIANENLSRLGFSKERIHFVGNTMIDTLCRNLERIRKPDFWETENMIPKGYFLLTLHRPSNVDNAAVLKDLLDAIMENSDELQVVFPVHPRTRQMIHKMGYKNSRLLQVDPQGYLEFIYLVKHARAIVTDSGGITEEATVLGVPCMTMRDTTERPETVIVGTNELIGSDRKKLLDCLQKVLRLEWKKGGIPKLWDGQTSKRIVEILIRNYS